MARWRKSLRLGPLAWITAGFLAIGVQGAAQEAPAPLLTLDQDRLFLDSNFGKAAIARERAATDALEQENRRIEAELVAEEQALTDLRTTLTPEEFTARADAFDAKVERIRGEQDAKSQTLALAREKDRKDFLQVAVPILGDLLGDKGAVAILDKNLVILSLSAIDVTDEAIARVNAALDKPSAPETPPASP
ncbi:MAG: OmpH family outer membrane protein [Tabrizicola sp.]|jgi:Skp family chaperone for outer membrane proteins|nr:OmpH family outer membrane protein [Tabrizicola sp.]